ncbi:fructose-bisphosphate aldolase [Candidatus Desantisbacteria bacterium CG02_land_8_20_14_3_00_49_13]|nr:MAG: fructose-bisphosphate aldolase [Candidatus Desantisbacteria bacterium CG1_02_49_89]PIV55825.1 MAG: fructose-bisphosphate aldolase [Candidatus Desantisbacteria bacterium CG02_land_8_20_14_3_00_49_13]
MIGKEIRIERILNRNTGKTVIIPMDHGVTVGPIRGLENMKETVDNIVNGGANAIVLHKGLVRGGHRGSGKDIGLIIHLSGSTSLAPDPNFKVLVCTVEEAVRLGADAVSIHVNLGAEDESEMLRDFGVISKKSTEWGIPLLAMMYTRGQKIKNQFDAAVVKHAARVGAELGADIVKVNYTGSAESFREVTGGCPVPVVIAGGEKMETDKEILEMVEGAMKGGAAGVSIGRNAFQHKDPIGIVKAIASVVHKSTKVEEALKLLK